MKEGVLASMGLNIENINQALRSITPAAAMAALQKIAMSEPWNPQILLVDTSGWSHELVDAQGKGYEVWVFCGTTPISSHGVESDNALSSAAVMAMALKVARHMCLASKPIVTLVDPRAATSDQATPSRNQLVTEQILAG